MNRGVPKDAKSTTSSIPTSSYAMHWPFPEFKEGAGFDHEDEMSEEMAKMRRAYSCSSSSNGSRDDMLREDFENDVNKSDAISVHTSLSATTDGAKSQSGAMNMSALNALRIAQQKALLKTQQKGGTVTAHPLSSDWNLVKIPRNFRDHLRHEIAKTAAAEDHELSRNIQSSHLRNSSHVRSVLSDHLSTISTVAGSPHGTEGGGRSGSSGSAPVTPAPAPSLHQLLSIDDITLLVKLFDETKQGASMSDLTGIDTRHISLGWLGRRHGFSKKVVPPLVNLHLGNFANVVAKCDGDIAQDRVLINSPRSAVVLLRSGISVPDLIPRPAVVRKARMLAAQSTLGAQTKRATRDILRVIGNASDLVLSRVDEEVERLRLQRLARLVSEYVALCSLVELQDIISFCSQYDKKRPSSAFRAECSLVAQTKNKLGDMLPEAAAEEKFQRLFDRHAAFERTVVNCQQKVIADDLLKRSEATARLVVEQERSTRLVAARQAALQQRKEARVAREEVKRLQHSAADRSRAYKITSLREPIIRRDDEVANIERARQRAINKYKKIVVQDIHKDDTKAANATLAMEMSGRKSISPM